MWLLSRQLLSPYTAMRPLWKAVRPSTACESPDAAVPKRPTDLVVPAFSAPPSETCTLVRQRGFRSAASSSAARPVRGSAPLLHVRGV